MAEKKPTETPMMKQFFAMKAQHPEAVLLFRCGDFYETYGDDALTASKVLGIVLTKRSSAVPGAIPMAGFPHHSLETYLPRLVRAGYKVAVCDQLEDPKLTKNIVKRGVTELVTPGVAFNEQLLEQKEHNYIAGLTFHKDKCGAAFLDVSTGTFQVAEGSLDYIGTLLSSFAPKELLVPRGYEKGTKERYGDHYYISTLEEWAFVYDNAVEKLKRQLQCVQKVKKRRHHSAECRADTYINRERKHNFRCPFPSSDKNERAHQSASRRITYQSKRRHKICKKYCDGIHTTCNRSKKRPQYTELFVKNRRGYVKAQKIHTEIYQK